jgi:hypothetical protein
MKNDLEQVDKIMKLTSETFLALQSLYSFIGDADHVDIHITFKLTTHKHKHKHKHTSNLAVPLYADVTFADNSNNNNKCYI